MWPSVKIYPREGTETVFVVSNVQLVQLKFIPVRGRKLRVLVILRFEEG